MEIKFDFEITPQPDDATCGPACLHALYKFHGRTTSHQQLIDEVGRIEGGGTLAAYLGLHALRAGYDVTIYTCNLQLFDPTWFVDNSPPLAECLRKQLRVKRNRKLHEAGRAYLDLLDHGGRVRMEDITPRLIREILEQGTPIIAGLSATWLYRAMRERPEDCEPDDTAGEPVGHFVVVHGIDESNRNVMIADPYVNEPYPGSHFYRVSTHTFISAVLLGIVTYDAKLLVIRKKAGAG